MAPKSKATKPQSKVPAAPKEYSTITAKLEAEYVASRPYLALKEAKGISYMTAGEQAAYANSRFLETGVWKTWSAAAQKDFLKTVEQQKIPKPLPKPKHLGKDLRGRDIGTYTPEEYQAYLQTERDIQRFRRESAWFRESSGSPKSQGSEEDWIGEIETEKNRRKLLARLQRQKMGKYEGDPAWDDVVPIPQEDGEGALAQIAYSDNYAEAMGYLRAVMAAKDHSLRVLDLTEDIISMNPAHYTVWLYRISTVFALDCSIEKELEWVKVLARDNQKNYQIWHHHQLLVDHLYSSISSDRTALEKLAHSELSFITRMFEADSKNYHVWSYRQYLVRKLNLFNDTEIRLIEEIIHDDFRNNSAWAHRFFVVFFNPSHTTPDSAATAHDPAVPDDIIDREIEFSKAVIIEAPQNQSPWNYLRGVLRKGGRDLATQERYAGRFVRIDGEEEFVESSHALDLLAEIWSEKGEVEKADKALRLLGDKYDPIRKNYWDWRRRSLKPRSEV